MNNAPTTHQYHIVNVPVTLQESTNDVLSMHQQRTNYISLTYRHRPVSRHVNFYTSFSASFSSKIVYFLNRMARAVVAAAQYGSAIWRYHMAFLAIWFCHVALLYCFTIRLCHMILH